MSSWYEDRGFLSQMKTIYVLTVIFSNGSGRQARECSPPVAMRWAPGGARQRQASTGPSRLCAGGAGRGSSGLVVQPLHVQLDLRQGAVRLALLDWKRPLILSAVSAALRDQGFKADEASGFESQSSQTLTPLKEKKRQKTKQNKKIKIIFKKKFQKRV